LRTVVFVVVFLCFYERTMAAVFLLVVFLI
jgi:hypothetical protein